ncbi:hypothetical protein [Microbacterium lacus]|uniref:hypothetical protein n=1 Tax=Microbacterium lacus TaxID=415217 RepID=UPI0012FDC74A|nr:hypothetical protein [Microbacterium lacus]
MNEKEPKVRQFIVDADALDGDGEDIADDQFGSGGARRADGTLINQYKNPRPYNAATADEDREFDAWLDRESKARTQREEAESQAAYDRRVQQTADGILWVLREVVAPIAQAYWDARGKKDVQRFGRWVASRVGRGSRKTAAESSTNEEVAFPVGAADASTTTIDTPVGIINLDDYRGRRAVAADNVSDGEDATTA